MEAEIGQFAVALALALSLAQAVVSFIGAARESASLMALGRRAALLQALFVAVGFCALLSAYVMNDFSVALVAEHSNAAQPLIYRLGATWGSHEGSILLWILILAVHGAAVAAFGGSLRESFQARVIAVQGVLGAAFVGFMVFTSNPFLRLSPPAVEGAELNPVLQDPGLVFHPPILYLGYVGFSIAFSFAVAALIEGRVDQAWARWVRPWVLASWLFLTVGITAGSLWAYYSLGWGGWWFWDPVENASFMPWLLGTALLHSALVLERRGALISWTILLAILTFSLSLVGTFLVRSGILTSVHAFAVDARRGVYILAIIGALTGGALGLFAWRAPEMRTGALFAPLSREGGITLNNLFLLCATGCVFLGTFYPVFVDALHGGAISVGPPYYRLTFIPLFLPLLFLAGLGPLTNWRRDELARIGRRAWRPALLALALAVIVFAVFGWKGVAPAIGLMLGVWLIAASGLALARRFRAEGGRFAWSAVKATPLAAFGLAAAHAGLGVSTIGISAMGAWPASRVLVMAPGDTTTLAGRRVTLDAVERADGPNYTAERARFTVDGPFGVHEINSERRLFPASGSDKTEAGIRYSPLGDDYIQVGEASGRGLIVRIWRHPLATWIWGGGLLMAFGGALSLADRGLRRARLRRTVPAAALEPKPALA